MTTIIPYSTSWLSKEDKHEYNKEYYNRNKEYFKEHGQKQNQRCITCTCGLIVIQKNLKRHQQSKQHQTRLNK